MNVSRNATEGARYGQGSCHEFERQNPRLMNRQGELTLSNQPNATKTIRQPNATKHAVAMTM